LVNLNQTFYVVGRVRAGAPLLRTTCLQKWSLPVRSRLP